MWLRILAVALLSAFCSLAGQLKLKTLCIGSVTYSNVVVLGANATDLYFTHALGIANVKLRLLSPELQKQFNYDPGTASAAERQQQDDEARYQEALAATMFPKAGADSPQHSVRTYPESLADPISEKSFLGKPAPALEVEKWLGDKPELAGKSVLVSFLTDWSLPCRKAIPELNALQKKFSGKLAVIWLSSEPPAELADTTGPQPQFPLALDTKARLRTALGVTSVPCVVLLDPERIVRYQGHPSALTEKNLELLLAKFAKEQ